MTDALCQDFVQVSIVRISLCLPPSFPQSPQIVSASPSVSQNATTILSAAKTSRNRRIWEATLDVKFVAWVLTRASIRFDE